MARLNYSALKHIFCIVFIALTCLSCKKNITAERTIHLADYPFSEIDNLGKPVFKYLGCYPISDGESFPVFGWMIGINDVDSSRLLLTDSNHGDVLLIDNTGHIISSFNRTGRGPGEYMSISGAGLDLSRGRILVSDLMKKDRLLVYDTEGNISEPVLLSNPAMASIFNPADNCVYSINASPASSAVSIYDLNTGLTRTSKLTSDKKIEGMVNIGGLYRIDDAIICEPPLSSELTEISNPEEPLFLKIDCGKLSMPEEYYSDGSKMENYGKNYIYVQSKTFFGKNYLFVEFLYDMKLFFDLWDIETGKLLYRRFASSEEDPLGYPAQNGSSIIHVSPSIISSEGTAFNVLDGESASSFGISNLNATYLLKMDVNF